MMVHYYVARDVYKKEAKIISSSRHLKKGDCIKRYDGTWSVIDQTDSDWFNEQLYNLITEELDDFTLANSIEENFRENGFPNNLDGKLIEAIDELSKVIGEIKVELMNARR